MALTREQYEARRRQMIAEHEAEGGDPECYEQARRDEARRRPSKPKAWKGGRPFGVARISSSRYQQASWSRDDLTFEQHLPSRSCTCEAGEKGHWCKHLTSAFLASLVDNTEIARQMPGQLRRKLLKQGTHRERPDIELALLVAEWEEARQEAAPPPAPPAPQAGDRSPATPGEEWDQAAVEIAAAQIDTALAHAGRDWSPRRRTARLPEGNRAQGTTRPIIAGYQGHSAQVAAASAEATR